MGFLQINQINFVFFCREWSGKSFSFTKLIKETLHLLLFHLVIIDYTMLKNIKIVFSIVTCNIYLCT